MYPITNEVKALFESEQRKVLRITGGVKTPIPNSVGPVAIASFDNAVAADALNVTVEITPVQSGSGDPSPTNIRPISGWTGANVTKAGNNLLSECSIGTVTHITASTDGETITLNGTVSGSEMYGFYITGWLTVKAGTYTLGANNSVAVVPSGESYCEIRFVVYDHNSGVETRPPKYRLNLKTVNAKKSMTFSEDSLIRLELRLYAGQVFNNFQLKPVLVIGNNADETDTTHTRTTIPILWQSEAGTVYGGTLDVTTGLLTVTMAEVDLGTLNWRRDGHNFQFYSDPIANAVTDYSGRNVICSCYTGGNAYSQSVNYRICIGEPLHRAFVTDDRYTDGIALKNALSGAQLVYELATPQTYQLTPTQVALLAGTNNVWADCGDTSVEYATGYDYEIDISDDNVIEDSFQIDRYSCNGEKLEVGTAIAAQMTFTLENGDGTYDGIVFEDTELFAEVGVADWTQENPTVHWVPCGYFTPDMQPRRLSTISITALDRMTLFDVVVDAADLTFPTTVAGLVGQVCVLCGVTLAQSISGLVNASVAVTELPTVQGEITYRNLIQWCAGIMGTNAWFDWNGQLRFSWYENTTGYVSTIDNRYSSDLYENDLTITGVEYTNDSGIAIVEGTDDYAIDLTGNAIAGPLIATVLPPLNTALNGFTYRPFTAATVNAPYLWPMDVMTFTDKDGNNHTSVLTNVAFGLNGTTAMESKGMTYAINKLAQPKGFTREQAQLVNQAMEHVEQDIDESLTQQEIFNRLTDNGAAQGLVLYNGQLYINASYINAGRLNVGFLDFTNYTQPYRVPNEFDPSSLLSGQSIVDGWIVQDGEFITVIRCDNAVPIRGQTIVITATTIDHVAGGEWQYYWRNSSGEEGGEIGSWEAPSYGHEDADGDMTGAIDEGEYERFSYVWRVPDDATSFSIGFGCSGVRNIVVSEEFSQYFGLRYGNNIGINYKGLQVGKFVVDRSGNVTANGDSLFNGKAHFEDSVDMQIPLPVASGGTGATTPANARANIGAVAKSGDTMTGNLTVHNNSATQDIILYANDDGTSGIYLFKPNPSGGWFYSKTALGIDSNGNVRLYGNAFGSIGGNGMVYKEQKTASDSLDSIHESGYWGCLSNNLPGGIPQDAPTTANGLVINYHVPIISTDYQIYIVFQGGVTNRYERRYNGTWSPWRKVQYAT